MDVECETSLVAKMPKTSQHFFAFSVSPRVYPIDESMASFFLLFLRITQGELGVFLRRKLAAVARLGSVVFLFW